jgi:DNA-binding NarL/FixJ family response regulator
MSDKTVVGVLIADDHAIVRDGLRALVDAQPGLSVVGEASDGMEAWRRACQLKPNVVVLDVSMPGLSGIEATERIARDCPDVKVLALTMHEERGYVARVLRAGAAGYALKRSASSELVRAIRAVVAGERYVDPSLAGALLTEYAARPARSRDAAHASQAASLTVREGEVLRLLALGHSNKEIASSLSISVKTVETHRASGMARLGLTSRAALVRFAVTEGWLKDV